MKKHLSSLLFFAAAVIWGFALAAQKKAAIIPALTIGSIRSLLAGLFLFCSIPLMDRLTKNGRRFISRRGLDFKKSELVGGVICGVILSVASTLQQSGLGEGTDAGKAAFITALYVLIVPLLSLLIGKRSPLNVWLGVVIAVIGFYFLCIKQDFTLEFSDALVLLCAVVFALHIMAIDHFSPGCDGVRLSCIQFLTYFIIATPTALIVDGAPDLSAIVSVLPAMLYFGICSGGLGYTLQIVGQGMDGVNPAVACIIMSLESVFGVIGGAIVLGEVLSLREYIGCAVVFAAVILSQLDMESIKRKIAAKREKSQENVN